MKTKSIKTILLVATLTLTAFPSCASAVEAWVQRYSHDVGSNDTARKIVTDSAGNVIVAGSTEDGNSNWGFLVIKYSSAGIGLWTNRYGGFGGGANALASDANGNVYVTGVWYVNAISSYTEYATVAYSSAGVALWTNLYDGPGEATAVAVGGNGNVYVTGYSGWSVDYATIAYNSAGVALWTNRYNGPESQGDYASAIAVGGNGNVYVTGLSEGNYATIAYNSAGATLWVRRYGGGMAGLVSAMALGGNGNVYVTGSLYNSGTAEYDYATVAYTSTGTALWTNRYNGPGNFSDQANAIAVGGNGNVYVTGSSTGLDGSDDYATIAYNSAGAGLWTNRYAAPGNNYEHPSAMAVDQAGNVYVTGNSLDDYTTVAYTSAGLALWTNRYDGPGNSADQASAIAVDGSGNVSVTGYSVGSSGSYDFATLAYDSTGVALWTNRYNAPGNDNDIATAVAVDGSGNVYVTGRSFGRGSGIDYATIAFNSAGVSLWTNRYNGPGNSGDEANAIAVDSGGNVYVTGSSQGSSSGPDYTTIAYNSTGVVLWTNRYNGPGNSTDRASANAVDGSGKVYVTGYSRTAGFDDYATIAYNSAGMPLWTNRYSGPGNDYAVAIAVDANGNVYVTGNSSSGVNNSDYATIAYNSAGAALWTNRYNGPGNSWDLATGIAVDGSGNVYVTGRSWGEFIDGSATEDYATIAYSSAGVPLWTNRYSGGVAAAIAVDGNGNVYVTGTSPGIGSHFDYATIAYDSAGIALWTNRYDASNNEDRANAIAVDGSGNVYVTGYSYSGFGSGLIDCATVAYSSAGVALWTNRYNGPANQYDEGKAIAVDGSGNVYVAGSSSGTIAGWTSDYTLIKYVPSAPRLAIERDNSDGFFIYVNGTPGQTYRLQRAISLNGPWSTISTNSAGIIEYHETIPPPGQSFYRTVQP